MAGEPNLDAGAVQLDALEHAAVTRSLLSHIHQLPAGVVIAVQGDWGRGKTHLLRRIFGELSDAATKGSGSPQPLWLNPWQYGRPDLITPLVLELLTRLEPSVRGRSATLRRCARALLRAGNAMIFKAVSVVAPLGAVWEAGSGPIDDLIKELFDAKSEHPDGDYELDLDPVASMARRFRELVEEYLRLASGGEGRLVICIDDLDRCLPNHQIAMLEAVHFLTGAQARASFVVALDPRLVRQAAVTHYGTSTFDTHQYLNKVFDLRVTLPSLSPKAVRALVHQYLEREVRGGPNARPLRAIIADECGISHEILEAAFGRFNFPELANPRLIRRVCDRMGLLVSAPIALPEQFAVLDETSRAEVLVDWCTIAERWPALRSLLQSLNHVDWEELFTLVTVVYDVSTTMSDKERELLRHRLPPHILSRLPEREQHPDLGEFVYGLQDQANNRKQAILALDALMIQAGL